MLVILTPPLSGETYKINIFARCRFGTSYYYAKNTTRERKCLRKCRPTLELLLASTPAIHVLWSQHLNSDSIGQAQVRAAIVPGPRVSVEPLSREERGKVNFSTTVGVYRQCLSLP